MVQPQIELRCEWVRVLHNDDVVAFLFDLLFVLVVMARYCRMNCN